MNTRTWTVVCLTQMPWTRCSTNGNCCHHSFPRSRVFPLRDAVFFGRRCRIKTGMRRRLALALSLSTTAHTSVKQISTPPSCLPHACGLSGSVPGPVITFTTIAVPAASHSNHVRGSRCRDACQPTHSIPWTQLPVQIRSPAPRDCTENRIGRC